MRIVGAVAVIGWGVLLALWLVLLVTAPLGRPQPRDWLVALIPLAGMAVSYLAATFWYRDRRLIGGLALAISLIGLAWMWHGLLDVAALIGHQAPS
jgi:hypothetical protein